MKTKIEKLFYVQQKQANKWNWLLKRLEKPVEFSLSHSSFRRDVLRSLPTGKSVVEPLLSYLFAFNIPLDFPQNASSATIQKNLENLYNSLLAAESEKLAGLRDCPASCKKLNAKLSFLMTKTSFFFSFHFFEKGTALD